MKEKQITIDELWGNTWAVDKQLIMDDLQNKGINCAYPNFVMNNSLNVYSCVIIFKDQHELNLYRLIGKYKECWFLQFYIVSNTNKKIEKRIRDGGI